MPSLQVPTCDKAPVIDSFTSKMPTKSALHFLHAV